MQNWGTIILIVFDFRGNKMGPPKPTISGFIPSYTQLQPWFFIGFAGVITTL